MAASADDLLNWILKYWGDKAHATVSDEDPVGDSPFNVAFHVNRLTGQVHSWNGTAWTEGLGGGGLEEVDWSIIQNKPNTDQIIEGINKYVSESQKTKLDSVESNAQANVPTHLSIPSIMNNTDTLLLQSSTGDDATFLSATISKAGLMSSSDKTKLNGLPTSANLDASLALKAPLASPALTGTPTAPTASANIESTQIATTSHVKARVDASIESYNESLLSSKFEPIEDNITDLQSVKADKSQIGVPSVGLVKGIADLDTGGKIPLSRLPDFILGQLVFGGMVDLTVNSINLTSNGAGKLLSNTGKPYVSGTNELLDIATDNAVGFIGFEDAQDIYFIVNTVAVNGTTFAGKVFQVGDWLLSTGTAWEKVDNTDLVTSVNGQVGNVQVATPDKNITISLPVLEEIPLTLKAYESFSVKKIAFKLSAGTCKFYFKRIRNNVTRYFTHDSNTFIEHSSKPALGTHFPASIGIVEFTDSLNTLTINVNDYFSLVISEVSTNSRMLSISIDA